MDLTPKPSLSVIVCNFNHAKFLPEALDAMLEQSYQPLEIIIVDDGSTDNSMDILREYASKNPVIHLLQNEKNRGIFFSVALALGNATGDYIYWGAADDRICPGLFEKSMALLAKFPKAGVCSALIKRIDHNGKDVSWIKTPIIASAPTYFPPDKVLANLECYGLWFTGQTIFLRRDLITSETDGYLAELAHRSDHFVDMVVALKGGACFIPEILGTYRILESGYAETSFDDTSLSRKTFANLINLMRSPRYEQLFSERMVKMWESVGLYDLEVRVLRANLSSQMAFIRRLREIRNKLNLFDILFFVFIELISIVLGALLNFYLLFRRFNWNFKWLAMKLKLKFSRFNF